MMVMVRGSKRTAKNARVPGKANSRKAQKASKSRKGQGLTVTGKAGAKGKDSQGFDLERKPSSFYEEYKRKHGDLLTAMGKVD